MFILDEKVGLGTRQINERNYYNKEKEFIGRTEEGKRKTKKEETKAGK